LFIIIFLYIYISIYLYILLYLIFFIYTLYVFFTFYIYICLPSCLSQVSIILFSFFLFLFIFILISSPYEWIEYLSFLFSTFLIIILYFIIFILLFYMNSYFKLLCTMNSTLYNSNFHHGIRHYKCVFYMIFIHKLKNWSVKKLFNFISNLTNSFFNIIFSIVRKFSPLYDSYFIIKEMLSIVITINNSIIC